MHIYIYTGEASYSRPKVLIEKEQYIQANERKYNATPINIVIHIFSYLLPYPERSNGRLTCALWNQASMSTELCIRVLPIESGIHDIIHTTTSTSKKGHNSDSSTAASDDKSKNKAKIVLEYNQYADLTTAITHSHRGDTILLAPGHYFVEHLTLPHPVKLLGQPNDPGRCIVEVADRVDLICKVQLGQVIVAGVCFQRPPRKHSSSGGGNNSTGGGLVAGGEALLSLPYFRLNESTKMSVSIVYIYICILSML